MTILLFYLVNFVLLGFFNVDKAGIIDKNRQPYQTTQEGKKHFPS